MISLYFEKPLLKDVTALLTHWSYVLVVLTHRYDATRKMVYFCHVMNILFQEPAATGFYVKGAINKGPYGTMLLNMACGNMDDCNCTYSNYQQGDY